MFASPLFRLDMPHAVETVHLCHLNFDEARILLSTTPGTSALPTGRGGGGQGSF